MDRHRWERIGIDADQRGGGLCVGSGGLALDNVADLQYCREPGRDAVGMGAGCVDTELEVAAFIDA